MTMNQKMRALRRVLNRVMKVEAEMHDDRMNDYAGFVAPVPPSVYKPVARALLQLRLSRADAVRELDPIITREGEHEPHGAPPASFYQSCMLHND